MRNPGTPDGEPGRRGSETEAHMTACCARCAASFGCGARAGRCWCQDLPSLAAPDPANGCYCPACLEAMLAAAGASDKVPGDAMPTGPPGRRRGTAK